ncbi:PDZ domain-containing protein [Parvibaculum sedimenti]|uniref:PDZ domain-containing protein n=1 Tax=Parvibaculum sedimenti TaxID=2608632 RepID=A0A6N6VRS7_9HYPH|nr:S41 family peptidase [Parvibaculum sedimenti]KAB7742183.1 PDZ domain-containing protein [Parvibaculum sedimenti]
MNKSVIGGFAIGTIVSALTVFALQPGNLNSIAEAADSDTYRQLNLFGDVFERVRADYVEPTDDAKLVESAINGMLTSLDPHSSYMNPKSFRDMQVQTRGEFGGLGIEVTMENGVVKVVTPIDETPASRAGLRPNDYITHIDGKPILGMTLSDAVDKMRGPVNTAVTLTIVRKGADEPFDVKLTRDIITIKSVKYHREGDIAYLRITSFNEQTGELLEEAIQTLKKQIGPAKVKGYVLDLRNNPGGLLEQAIAVSSDFVSEGEIVSTRGRHAEDTQRYNARGGDLTGGKPVIVLVNGGSASASEIVAGALQDHRRAVILGTRSFGKGSVQTIIPLGSDGALRLTTARYFTPSGHSIQAKGIVPDIQVEQNTDPKLKKRTLVTGEAELPGHLAAEDGAKEIAGSDSFVPTDKKDDKQLLYAIDLLNGVRKDAAFKSASSASAN